MFKYALAIGLTVGAITAGLLHFTANAATVVAPMTPVTQLQGSSPMLQPTVNVEYLQPATAQIQGNNGDTQLLQPTVAGTDLQ